jgi:hypothetical protein
MKNRIYLLASACFFLIACQSKKPQNFEKTYPGYDYTIELDAKAVTDSAFRNSKAYSFYKEKEGIEKAKKLRNNGEVLQEFEKTIISLRESTNKLKLNPNLSKNEQFKALIQLEANKVREYQQLLKTMPLNNLEKEQYKRICKM